MSLCELGERARVAVEGMKRRARDIAALLLVIMMGFLTSCGLPKIMVLDDPLTPEEHLNLGVAYERNGELDHALMEYERASKALPEAYLYLGNVWFLKKDFEKAERYYRKALKEKPEIADTYNNLAWLFYVRGDNLEEAAALAREAMRLDPAKASVYQDTLKKIREVKRMK